MQKEIGFIGIGHMGFPMAKNLLNSGYKVHVFDLAESALDAIEKEGAVKASSVAEVAEKCTTILSILPEGPHVRSVYLGDEGLIAHAKPHSFFMECSTIGVETSKLVHIKTKSAGHRMVDAPVSGGVGGAKAGTLTFMVGGSDKDFQEAFPIFDILGKNIIHTGGDGMGQVAKTCNNLLLGISMIGTCEAFALGKKLGIDPQRLFEVISQSSGQCWSVTSYCPEPGLVEAAPSNRDYEPGFTAAMMLKDLKLAEAAASLAKANIPIGDKAIELYEKFCKDGFDGKDFSGIIEEL